MCIKKLVCWSFNVTWIKTSESFESLNSFESFKSFESSQEESFISELFCTVFKNAAGNKISKEPYIVQAGSSKDTSPLFYYFFFFPGKKESS